MAAFTYNGVITLGSYQYTLDAKATITCTKKNSTTITLSINKSQSTSYNHIYFPNGATNISLYVGIATSSSGTYTYKQVYYGWDPLPGSTSRQFTSSQSWDYTVSASDTTKTVYIKFKVVDEGNGSNTILTTSPSSSSFSFSAGTTACTAPTSVWVASGVQTASNKWIVAPNNSSSIKFQWSGAAGGTNNSISGYRIYWQQSSWPTTTSYVSSAHLASTASAASLAITGTACSLIGANAERGSRIGFGIVTEGSAGSTYNSSIKKIQGVDGYGILINRLPSKPTVTPSSVIIQSTQSSAPKNAFSITAGTDGDGQTYTTYYSKSVGGTKNMVSSVTTWEPGTYYFWTYDGLEYSSSYTQATVTKNTQPTVTLSYGTPTTYTALNDTHTYTSRIPITITPDQSGKTGTLSYTWKYCTASSYNGTYSSWTTLKTGAASSISSTNPKTWAFNFALQLGDSYDGSKYYKWQVDFIFNDGIESTTASSNIYYYSPAPNKSTVTAYNTFSDANASGTTAAVICQKYRVKCYRDTSWSSTVVSVYDNTDKKSIGIEVSDTTDITYHWVDISLNSLPASGNSITIKVQFLCSSSNITKDVCNNTVTEYNNPVITYAPASWTTYNVYTDTGTIGVGYSVNGTVGSAEDYRWFAQYGSYIDEVNFASWSASGANITASISAENAYNFNGNIKTAISEYAGNYTIKTGIRYRNVFGQDIYSNTKDITYNFDTAPTFSGSPSYYYTTSTATNVTPSSLIGNRYIQEDLPFRIHGVVNYYSNRDIKVTVLQDSVEFGSKIININSGSTNRTGVSTSFDITDVVKTIASSTNNKTNFIVKTELVDVPSLSTVASSSLNSIYIKNPMSEYSALDLNNDTFTATVTVSAAAAVPTSPINSQSVQMAVINASTDTTKKQLSEWVTIPADTTFVNLAVNTSYSDWNTQTGYLQTITTVVSKNATNGGTGFTTRKYVISQNSYAVSKDNPTVSYRKNFVGINTPANMTAPSDEVLQIRAIAGHNSISFRDENGLQTAEFVAQNSAGLAQLAFPSAADTHVEMNSNGIYMNGTENHIQVKNLDITPTSISLPSNGKIYINSNDLLLDILYPVGSTVCMSNLNANPSTRLGGTWELSDKQFINVHSSDVSSYFTAVSSAIKSPAIRLYRAGHSISIRLQFTTVAAMSTTSAGVKLGEFDLEALGIRDDNLPTPRPLFWGGGTSQSLLAIVNTSGELMGYNVVPSGTLPANTTLLGFWTLVAPPYMATDSVSYMLDSACDKFYFTRTS